MATDWTPQTTAQAFLETFPMFGRLLSIHMREMGEEEATLMQLRAIMQIQEQPTSISELAKRRKVSMQSASVLVQGLVEKGWLTRIPNPKDRRQSLLQATSEGIARAEASHQMVSKVIADILQGLTPEELEAASVFLPALRRVVTAHINPETLPEA